MRWILALLCAVTLARAQVNFGPLRLDDHAEGDRYYARIRIDPQQNLLCTWARATSSRLAGYGQRISPGGEFLDSTIVYMDEPPGHLSCPPSIQIVFTEDGGQVRLTEFA
jgi:hypothetical protein